MSLHATPTDAWIGRTVLIAGGAGGLGQALTDALVQRGVTVLTIDVVEGASGERNEVCDTADATAVRGAVGRLMAVGGPLHGLVCATGVVSEHPLAELSVAEWRRVADASLTSAFVAAQAAAPHLARVEGAAIVTTSTGWATKGYPQGPHYAAAKAGVEALTKSLALELAAEGVRANCVAPGPFRTPMLQSLPDFDEPARAAGIPLGRIGEVGDIVDPIIFLLGPASRWMTGQVLHVNGGMLMP